MPISEWELGFDEIGKKNEYTPIQIKMYGEFIKMCADGFKSGELCRPDETATK